MYNNKFTVLLNRKLLILAFFFSFPGNPKDIHGVPYSLTEEFTSVYRMHPFLPEKIVVRDHQTNAKGEQRKTRQLSLVC